MNGAYAQLVDAQKIRAKVSTNPHDEEESTDEVDGGGRFVPSNAKVPLATSDTEKAALREEAKAEMPAGLEKSATRGSVASAILAQRAREQDTDTEKIPSIFYLLYRLALINATTSSRSTFPASSRPSAAVPPTPALPSSSAMRCRTFRSAVRSAVDLVPNRRVR